MKTFASMAAAATIVALGFTATPASAQLLGGVLDTVGGVVESVTGGGDSGGGSVGGIVESVTGGGDSGGGGVVGGLLGGGDGGGSSGLLGGLSSGGDVGIPGVATVNVSSNGGGTNGNGTLLGGGGGNLNLPLGSLLGGNSGVNVNLPGLNGIIGGPGAPGQPGAPGRNGINGSNGGGSNGFNGVNGVNGRAGANGVNFNVNIKGSSRLALLNRILQNRAWLRFAQGNKLCLPSFGVASAGSFVKPNEYGKLQELIGAYGNDIATLQQMLKRCRNGQNNSFDVNRVIGVDQREDGQIVVMTI